jgi:hypothetical protein
MSKGQGVLEIKLNITRLAIGLSIIKAYHIRAALM